MDRRQDTLKDICRRFSLPCTPGDRLADPSTCRQYYECGHDGLYLMKRECPPTTGYDYQRGGCRRVVDFQCVSPVKCPTNIWGESDKTKQTDNFPTELVIGGTLGSLSLLTIFLLVVACIRKWRIENESRRLRKMRRTLRSHRLPPVLDNPHFLHMDKVTSIYQKLNDNNCHQIRHIHRYGGHASSSEHGSSDYSDPALYIPGEQRFDSSIITGSFVYHTPGNLPEDFNHNVSYDSFKNDHMRRNDGFVYATSTLTQHPQF